MTTPGDGAPLSRGSAPISILLVDDHALLRESLRESLDAQPDLVVVGEAGTSAAAVAQARLLQPDVILLDVEIPGDDVTVTMGHLRRLAPSAQVLILSMYDGPQLLQQLIDAGIRGYLLKTITTQELLAAVRSVVTDHGRLVLNVSRETLGRLAQGPRRSDLLSDREREVLELTARALSNAQIATRLSLTEATVKRHLRNIFAKLGAVSRIDAVNKAMAASLITGDATGPRRR